MKLKFPNGHPAIAVIVTVSSGEVIYVIFSITY